LTTKNRKPRGLKTRRVRHIDRRDGTKHRGIPVTTVPLTLVHLAAELEPEDLARACHEAGVKYRIAPRHVKAVLKRMPNAKGATTLKAIMSGDVKVLRSKLENRFMVVLIGWAFPRPDPNRIVDGRYADCRWKDKQVIVELVSFKFHNSRHAWDNDYERECEAYARDDAFRRYTYKDVFEDPTRMRAELEKLLT